MDYEKKYKEALKRAREWYNKTEPDSYTCIVESIFLELKESEDERIRKELVNYFTEGREFLSLCSFGRDKILAWLEKQESLTIDEEKQGKEDVLWCIKQAKKYAKDENEMGTCWFAEQWLEKQGNKPQGKKALKAAREEKIVNANKVEHKFKVGDWIVNQHGTVRHIEEVGNVGYQTDEGWLTHDCYEKDFHLWTIQDARDGDVLYSPCCKLLWIYKDEKTCHVGSNLNYNSGSIVINKPICIPTDVQPATKEQRELMFQKMRENGYEWDVEMKELMKIEDVCMYSTDNYTDKERKTLCEDCKIKCKYNPTNNTFSSLREEDERMFRSLHNLIYVVRDCDCDGSKKKELSDWLESLKNRVQPKQKQEWSDEDEGFLRAAIKTCLENYGQYSEIASWLKSLKQRYISLKQRYIWKPSDKQIRALRWVLNNIPYNTHKEEISGLLDQIKDL